MTKPKPPSQPECRWIADCVEMCAGDPVAVIENGVEACFDNPRQSTIRKIYYDDCYCKDRALLKADYVVGFAEVLDVIVELKGSDLDHAYAQVEHTLERWKTDAKRYRGVACLIVHTRREATLRKARILPRWQSRIGNAERRFLRTNKALLLIRESGAQRFKLNDFLRTNNDR